MTREENLLDAFTRIDQELGDLPKRLFTVVDAGLAADGAALIDAHFRANIESAIKIAACVTVVVLQERVLRGEL